MSTDIVLAKLAKAIYEPEPECRRQAAELGYELVESISQHDADVGIFLKKRDPVRAAIVPRGTQVEPGHSRDWRENFGWPEPWAGPGLVHAGYNSQVGRMRDKARSAWERLPTAVPVDLTAHSLGGSGAHILGSWFCSVGGGQIARLVTFGAPRAGTAAAWEPLRNKGVDVRVYQITGDFAVKWPYYAPFRLCQPAEPIRLKSPKWWYGPLRRHWVETYIAALQSLPPPRGPG